MPTQIAVQDQSFTGKTFHELTIELPDECLTVRELIRSRVYQEVKDFNVRQATQPTLVYQGLVEPTKAEAMLNGNRDQPRLVDWQKQFERAVKAFKQGKVLILVDEKQFDSLDDQLTVNGETRIRFLRLTPLAGG